MMKMFRKAERVVAEVVDPDAPVEAITTQEHPNPHSFGDDISLPNLVRQNAPRHIEKLQKERALYMKKIEKIDEEITLLHKLKHALESHP